MTPSKTIDIFKSTHTWLVIILFITASAFIYLTQKVPSINDSIGYEHAGKQLSLGEGPTYTPPNELLDGPYFSLYAFQISRENDPRMYLGYPPGFPLLLAIASLLTGDPAFMPYVVPLLSIMGIIFSYLLGNVLSEKSWIGFGTTVILVSLPTYWYYSTATWSEVPSMTLVLIGTVFYFWSHQTKTKSYHNGISSFLGGFFISYSIYIRFTNVLFLPAFLFYEILTYRRDIFKNKSHWPFFIVAGLGVISIPIFNYFYYGGVFTTSYSPAHGWYPYLAFSLQYALGPSFVSGYSLIEVVKTLWGNFNLFLFLVPIGWIYLKKKGVFLAAATLIPISLYSVYAFAPSGINSRFLIPTFPFISIAIATTIYILGNKINKPEFRLGLAIVLFIILLRGIPEDVSSLKTRNLGAEATAETIKDMVSFSEENAVFLSYTFNDQISIFGNRSVLNFRRIPPSDAHEQIYHMEVLEPCLTYMIQELHRNHIPVYYVSHDNFWDVKTKLENHFQLEPVEKSPAIFEIKSTSATGFAQNACLDQTR